MRSVLYLLYFFLFNLVSVAGFGQLTINEFLRSANEDLSLKVIDDQSSFIQQKSYTMNVVNRAQFRLQNSDGFGFNRQTQRVGLWVSPENPWAIINNNRYFKAYSQSLVYQRDFTLKKALHDRYIMVIDFLFFSELKALRQKEKDMIDEQLRILETQQLSDFFNANLFADLKLQQIAKVVDVEEALFNVENQITRIDALYLDAYIKEIGWNFNDVVTLDQISAAVDSMESSETVSPLLKFEESRIEVARYSRKIQQSNINTGFLQGKYSLGKGAKGKNPWSYVAGITIPIFNPNKGDMARKQLNVIEAENRKMIGQTNLTAQKIAVVDRLKNLLSRYRETQEKISALNIKEIASTLSSMNANNPFIIVKLNSSALKLEAILLSLKQSILTSYIELLDVYDHLQQRPLVNYLSARLNKIDEE